MLVVLVDPVSAIGSRLFLSRQHRPSVLRSTVIETGLRRPDVWQPDVRRPEITRERQQGELDIGKIDLSSPALFLYKKAPDARRHEGEATCRFELVVIISSTC